MPTFGSISSVMFGMLLGLIAAFSPVWKTRYPTLFRFATGSPKKSTSLPKATFSAGGPAHRVVGHLEPRLPMPNGGWSRWPR